MERAVLIGLDSPVLGNETSGYESLDELEELLNTAGGECVGKLLQRRNSPDRATFVGEGKLEEAADLAKKQEADLIIFDNDLTPSQLRNAGERTGLVVLDRSALILDIFANRAQTSEGRLQVELAQYKYALSKLVGLGKSMSRLGGGIGTRGPGESKLETDRRHIRRRIDKLKEELERVKRVRDTQSRVRRNSGVPAVAIVGYTNAGKSTLLNALTGAGTEAKNRLFDTLDPITRKLNRNGITLLFSDTVGFIRKLPHGLIDAFKATLDELKYADIILHVIDVSSPEWETQAEVTERIIADLGAGAIPCVRAYNKVDIAEEVPAVRDNAAAISAKTGVGLDALLDVLIGALNRD